MKEYKNLILMSSLFLLACGGSTTINQEQISDLEAKVAAAPNVELMTELYQAYQDAMPKVKQDTAKARLLWKSAETARGLKKFDAAEAHYADLYNNHKQSEWAPKALFLHAFMLDEDMGAMERAAAMYRQYLSQYPNSDFADDAQFLLENLGKSDEEILKILTEKQQEQNPSQE